MNVKMLVNQVFIRKLKGDSRRRAELVNSERYWCFMDVFGRQSFGFILAGDLLREARGGRKASVYRLGYNMSSYRISEGVDSDLFLLSSFATSEDKFSSRGEIEDMLEYLERATKGGMVGSMVNSSRSVLFEDKISALELQTRNFAVPKTYHFDSFDSFSDFVRRGGEYVVKHRFGQEGIGVSRVNKGNVGNFRGHDMEDFIVQERLDTTYEKRIVIYDGDVLAARIIMDRMSPWEKPSYNCITGETRVYNPTDEEIKNSVEVMRASDTLIGAVDWVGTKDGRQYYMELNGFGTGFGRGKHPYNVNLEVARRLRRDFLDCEE
jgi:glutathione synthase/RimK-type ligase-like ATP-grasp enzyme